MTPTRFVQRLARQAAPPNSLNLYAGRSKAARLRRQNLLLYFEKMTDLAPAVLLVGEAPGHKGARLTGVPFTCETLLSAHPFFSETAYTFLNPPSAFASEQSANIVWNALDGQPSMPLIWNIFPFHPHQPENPNSNRSPNQAELDLGKIILTDLMSVFPITHIGAVGRKAESMLQDVDLPVQYIRHPARGGKKLFIAGLDAFLQGIQNPL